MSAIGGRDGYKCSDSSAGAGYRKFAVCRLLRNFGEGEAEICSRSAAGKKQDKDLFRLILEFQVLAMTLGFIFMVLLGLAEVKSERNEEVQVELL